MYEILWNLRTTAPDKATALLGHLRANQGGDVGAILENWHQDLRTSSDVDEEKNAPSPSSSATKDTTSLVLNTPEIIHHPKVLAMGDTSVKHHSITLPTSSWVQYATVDGLEGVLQMFFACLGTLFYIADPEDVQKSVQMIRASKHAQTPLGSIVGEGDDLPLITVASELAGMAAVGVVHSQLADPATAPPSKLADYFYAVAKHGLDYAIQYNPLRAVKGRGLGCNLQCRRTCPSSFGLYWYAYLS